MAIIKGAINFGSNFNIGAKGPIDARQRVQFIADLTTAWTTDIPAYKGMVVSVLQDNSIYILTADDATKKENWKKIGDVSGDITNLQDQITANKAAIDKINGEGDGSITKAVSDAKTELIGNEATADTIKHAEKLATDASAKVDTEIGKLNSIVNNEATSAGDAASTQIKVTVEETKGKLTGVTVNAPSFESAGAASAVKTELIGNDESTSDSDTIKGAKKYTDDSIAALDVTGNTSEAVKGVTITVDETDGKVIKPVVSIADGTLTGADTDGNLVTGSTVKTYVDGKVKTITDNADALSGRVDKLDATHTKKGDGSFNTVAEEVTTGIAGIAETSKAAGSDVVVTVTTKSGSVSSVAVDSSVLKKAVTDEVTRAKAAEKKNADAIAAETTRATAAEKKNADAIVAETTRATAAEGQVKTDLIGGAAADYNTLGKLETKIKAAQSAADNAQATADAKVASVTTKDGETAIEVDNTTATTPKISLKLDNDGNVQFVQTAKGLKGSVEIPEATVTGVKADDKFLSLADKLVSADVSIAYDADDKKIYLYGKDKTKANAVSSIDCRDFIKDGMLTDAELVTNPAGQPAGTYIKLTWNTDGGKQPMYINVTSLIDVYTAGNGLNLSGHVFSVDTTKIATVESVNGVTSRVSTLEGKVATIEGEGEGSIKKAVADEADRAMQAEAALLGKPNTDTSNSNTIYGAKKYTDASIAALDVTDNTSEAVAGIAVTVNETDGIVSKPEVSVTPGSVAAGNASIVTGGAVYTAVDDAKSALIGTDKDTSASDTIKGAKKAVEDLKAQIKADAVTLTIPDDDPYITASKAEGSNTYTISSKKDGTTPLVDVKINTKLTEKINSLGGGGTSPAVKGVTVTVNETNGIVATPSISIADGTIGGASDTNLVTGDTVKTYVDTAITNAALVWHDIPTTA